MGLSARLLTLACLLAPSAVDAQLAPVGVPAGALRVELDGAIDIWDRRWRDGTREPLSADLAGTAIGSEVFPFLSDGDARIARITGLSGYQLNLGDLSTDAQAEDSRLFFGAAIGLTRAITVFGRMPLVRVRSQTRIALTQTASSDAGPNPGGSAQAAFFDQLDASLGALGARIAAGDFDADPALKARAQSTLGAGGALRTDLFGLLSDPGTAAPFVPTAGSVAGAAINGRVTDLQTTLATDFGVGGFTVALALPAEPVSDEQFGTALSDPAGAVAVSLQDTKTTFRGDAEAGVALTLVDRWDRGPRWGGFRAAVEALIRLPTGRVGQPNRLLTLGTGEGQTDVEVRLTSDLGAGRWGLRAEGTYTRQLAADFLVRVAPPTQPLASLDLLSGVRRDPGDIVSIAVRPFFRLTPTLALQATGLHWTRGEDDVSYLTPADQIPGVDAAVLAQDSKVSATVLGVGITYSHPGRMRAGGSGLPIDASWGYERLIRSGGGITPDRHGFRAKFRMYFGLF